MRVAELPMMLVAASTIISSHASAQDWRLQPRVQREIQLDVSDLDRQIDRAVERRAVSVPDAMTLRRDAAELQRQFAIFSRDGLDRREVEELESRVNSLRQRLKLELRKWGFPQ